MIYNRDNILLMKEYPDKYFELAIVDPPYGINITKNKDGMGRRNTDKKASFHMKKIHPTQKPIELYAFCLNEFAQPGDKILDTHLGSGTIRIACDILGYELTACESDPVYFKDSEELFRLYKNQNTLF